MILEETAKLIIDLGFPVVAFLLVYLDLRLKQKEQIRYLKHILYAIKNK